MARPWAFAPPPPTHLKREYCAATKRYCNVTRLDVRNNYRYRWTPCTYERGTFDRRIRSGATREPRLRGTRPGQSHVNGTPPWTVVTATVEAPRPGRRRTAAAVARSPRPPHWLWWPRRCPPAERTPARRSSAAIRCARKTDAPRSGARATRTPVRWAWCRTGADAVRTACAAWATRPSATRRTSRARTTRNA